MALGQSVNDWLRHKSPKGPHKRPISTAFLQVYKTLRTRDQVFPFSLE